MNNHIKKLADTIAPYREKIIHHKVYSQIKSIHELNIFMKYHVYAVWDFMSLLKSLQNNLTCTTLPWFPKGSADTRFLINEIVVGEESDVDMNGNRMSHFELYLAAMKQSGADESNIKSFINVLIEDKSMEQAFDIANVPAQVRKFVNQTFNVIHTNQPHIQAAVFTFGREDLIPGMFHSIIHDIHKNFPDSISIFKYYLERHIEVDGDHHSHLALDMTERLCGDDEKKWSEATENTIASLQSRILLWDGVYDEIMSTKN